jgi:hypothetical protein
MDMTNNGKHGPLITGIALACLLALNGCANAAPLVTLSPVGPKPADAQPAAPMLGYLKVYSSTREYNNGDVLYYPRRRYFIYNMNGSRYRTVENRASRKDEEPQLISLPVGKYYVIGESESDGLLRVPVVIKQGEKTGVVLERGKSTDTDAKVDSSRGVKTPSGNVVGWPAH